MRQCPTCGATVPEQATMCPDCGMDLTTQQTAQHPPIHAGVPAGSSPTSIATPAPTPAPSMPPVADPAREPMIPPAPSTPDVAPPSTPAPTGGQQIPPLLPPGAAPHDAAASAATVVEPASHGTAGNEIGIGSPSPVETSGQTPPSHSTDATGGTSSETTARLTLRRTGALSTETFPIAGETIVGRFDPESGPIDVDLGPLPEAVYISRHHAQLRQEAGQWFIKDLGSRNGTFVRAGNTGPFQRVAEETAIHDGDEIALGNARFAFRVGA